MYCYDHSLYTCADILDNCIDGRIPLKRNRWKNTTKENRRKKMTEKIILGENGRTGHIYVHAYINLYVNACTYISKENVQ